MKPFILVQVETPHTPVINKALPGTWCGRGEVVTNRKNKVFAAKLLPGGSVPPSESPVCTHSHTLTHTHTYMWMLSYTHICEYMYTHMYTLIYSYMCTHIYSNKLTQHTFCSCMHTHLHPHTHTDKAHSWCTRHTHPCADALAHIHMLSEHTPPLTVTYTHSHILMLTHVCPHTHTHTFTYSHARGCVPNRHPRPAG